MTDFPPIAASPRSIEVLLIFAALLILSVVALTSPVLADSSISFSSGSATSSTGAAGRAMPQLGGTDRIRNPYERRYLATIQEAERLEAERIRQLEKQRIQEKKRKEKEELIAQKKKERALRQALRRHQMAIGKHNKIISEREKHFSLYRNGENKNALPKIPRDHLETSPDSNPENANLWGQMK